MGILIRVRVPRISQTGKHGLACWLLRSAPCALGGKINADHRGGQVVCVQRRVRRAALLGERFAQVSALKRQLVKRGKEAHIEGAGQKRHQANDDKQDLNNRTAIYDEEAKNHQK